MTGSVSALSPRGAVGVALVLVIAPASLASDLDVSNLRFAPGESSVLVWDAPPGADAYGLHRGGLGGLGFKDYDHVCVATEIPEARGVDEECPEPGRAFYYLATGLAQGELGPSERGSLGRDGEGALRPPGPLSCGARIFADPSATGAGDGSSWEDAYTTLEEAFDHPYGRYPLGIWAAGSFVEHDLFFTGGTSVRVVGGFRGEETRAWERDPASTPTRWSGGGETALFFIDTDGKLLLDGLTLSDASEAVSAWSGEALVDVRSCRFERIALGVRIETRGGPGNSVSIEESRFAEGAPRVLYALAAEGPISVRARRVVVEAGGGEIPLQLSARSDTFPSSIDAEIVGCTIHGGDPALLVEADPVPGELGPRETRVEARVASTAILDPTGDGVVFRAHGVAEGTPGDAVPVEVLGLVVNTTIDAPAGDAVVTAASREERGGPPELFPVRAAPELWDNLLTAAGGYALREGEDDPAASIWADPRLVGNNLHGAATLYLDEGTTPLGTIVAVNALGACRENVDEDPGYASPGNDRHLAAGSSSIDAGHADVPFLAAIDFEGEPRRRGAAADRGADEWWPLP
jgi:hypothetical protein